MDGGRNRLPTQSRFGAALLVIAFFAGVTAEDVASAPRRRPPPPPPPGASAVDAYRESMPTSAGPHVVGSGARRVAPLPPAIEIRIRRNGGKHAGLLEKVATSSDLGAPPVRAVARNAHSHSDRLHEGSFPHGLGGAVLDAAGEGPGGARMLVLLGLAVVAAAAAIVLRLRGGGLRHDGE
jgi:hypothetical protein